MAWREAGSCHANDKAMLAPEALGIRCQGLIAFGDSSGTMHEGSNIVAVQGPCCWALRPVVARKLRAAKAMPRVRRSLAEGLLPLVADAHKRHASSKDVALLARKAFIEGILQWHQSQEADIRRQKAEAWKKRVEALKNSDMGVRQAIPFANELLVTDAHHSSSPWTVSFNPPSICGPPSIQAYVALLKGVRSQRLEEVIRQTDACFRSFSAKLASRSKGLKIQLKSNSIDSSDPAMQNPSSEGKASSTVPSSWSDLAERMTAVDVSGQPPSMLPAGRLRHYQLHVRFTAWCH